MIRIRFVELRHKCDHHYDFMATSLDTQTSNNLRHTIYYLIVFQDYILSSFFAAQVSPYMLDCFEVLLAHNCSTLPVIKH